jgi:hypothetical protein
MPTYDIYLEDSKYRDLRLLPRPIQKTGGRYARFRLNRRSTAQPIDYVSHLVYCAYFGLDFYFQQPPMISSDMVVELFHNSKHFLIHKAFTFINALKALCNYLLPYELSSDLSQ